MQSNEFKIDAKVEILKRMSFSEKWNECQRLRALAWDLKKAALTELHPEWSSQQIENEVRRIFLHATT